MTERILPPEHAWYLYGVATRSEAETRLPPTAGVGGAAPVAAIGDGALAAFVSAVPLAEFAADRVRSLAQDDAWLGRIAGEHERVVATLQRRLTIVPARLFSVYASEEDIVRSLAESESTILRTLQQLESCDEFEVRLTFDRDLLRKSLSVSIPEIAQLLEKRTGSSAGRAYLVDRQIASLLKRHVEDTITSWSDAAFAELRLHAIAGGDLTPLRLVAGESARVVLRRTFLIRRAKQDDFLEAVERAGELRPEIKVEYGGPWPPYNFADPAAFEEQGSMHG
jgi:hypothetical protein